MLIPFVVNFGCLSCLSSFKAEGEASKVVPTKTISLRLHCASSKSICAQVTVTK